MFQQDLLPSNRVARNEPQQYLSSEDCAYTVNRIRITLRLRSFKVVFKVGWPSHSCWL